MEILNAKVGEFSIGQAILVGLAKVGSEKLLAQTPVGNSTYTSGAIKLASSWGVGKLSGKTSGKLAKAGDILATGMAVDGVEDIWVSFFNGIGGEVPLLGNARNSSNNSGVMII